MNRRGFLEAILAAGVAPAFVGASILMPVKALAAPEHKAIILPNTEVFSPGSVSVLGCVKQPLGHRLRLATPNGNMYLDAVLPAAWWVGDAPSRAKFQLEHAARLYAERAYRAPREKLATLAVPMGQNGRRVV